MRHTDAEPEVRQPQVDDRRPLYVREEEVAKMLDVSLRKIQQDRASGSGVVFHKFGRSVRYRLQDVEEYIAACRRTSTSSRPTKDE